MPDFCARSMAKGYIFLWYSMSSLCWRDFSSYRYICTRQCWPHKWEDSAYLSLLCDSVEMMPDVENVPNWGYEGFSVSIDSQLRFEQDECRGVEECIGSPSSEAPPHSIRV